jgi:phosphoglycolate phosphatase-like HAD superfamily hydrolase
VTPLSPLDAGRCSAVLFDLDGTLVDTAPDMVAVLQDLQRAHGLEPVDYELGRAYVSNGALGLLGLGFPDIDTVSGDTLPQRKPDPAPLLHACELAGLLPQNTVYVGDASRDIEAGQNAGMATIAAAYGYVTPGDDPRRWGADLVAATTAELTQILLKAVNLDA